MDQDFQTALTHFGSNRIAAAMPMLASVVEKDPANLEASYKLGVCYFRLKNLETAERQFRAVIGQDPEHVEAWYYLGLALERQGHNDKARVHYQMALRLNPGLEFARKKLGLKAAPEAATNGGRRADLSQSASAPSASERAVFETRAEDGPGLLLFSSKRRRFASFSVHIVVFPTLLVALLMLNLFPRFHLGDFDAYGLMFMCLIVIVPTVLDLILRSITTKVNIYERRIDIRHGVFFRHQVSIWLFEITNLSHSRNPVDLVTGNAKITLTSQSGQHRLDGLMPPRTGDRTSSVRFTQSLFEELRTAVRDQRGSVKKVWI